jgi:glutamate synthase domain-containing protein 2
MRIQFIKVSVAVLIMVGIISYFWHPMLFSMILFGPLIIIGVMDMTQTKQAIRRNFPILGHGRYLMEMIRPEINQYFVESNRDGVPFNREQRSVVYQRAKGVTDTIPFGTQDDVYKNGYEWINHSLAPKPLLHQEPRVKVGGKDCKQPYMASILNISAMSFGSLSENAVLALNRGAKMGGFAHNTGEGGLSPFHLEPGGDIIWQVGTGYFSCRSKDGKFSPEEFEKRANLPNVKMIEIKLSQGAKPGHGGILPGAKVTPLIAGIRGVEIGKDVLSPPAHTAFSTPAGLLEFVAQLRKLSNGKPIGFKLCLGKRHEFLAICKAMLKTGITPDFITVDGGEGGTGAAPLEFSNSIGTPLNDALNYVNNALIGCGLRDQIRIIASGKVHSGFTIANKIALGADMCNSARGMMFALGCIQALRCNTNACPTGVTTHDPELTVGLVVSDKAKRVANFHKNTVHSFLEVIAAAGLAHPSDLKPWYIQRRISPSEARHYGEIYPTVEPGSFLAQQNGHKMPDVFAQPWARATPDSFSAVSH